MFLLNYFSVIILIIYMKNHRNLFKNPYKRLGDIFVNSLSACLCLEPHKNLIIMFVRCFLWLGSSSMLFLKYEVALINMCKNVSSSLYFGVFVFSGFCYADRDAQQIIRQRKMVDQIPVVLKIRRIGDIFPVFSACV